ncbi:MAG: cytochrome c553 [Flavobacteriales bacterium]|jgi:cytochrome c553
MKNTTLSTLIAICLMALAGSAIADGDIASGEAQVVAVCATCHGADGNSQVSTFPKLAGLGEKYLVNQMRYIKACKCVDMMAGILDNKTEQDFEDIAAYFSAQQIQLSGAKKDLKVMLNDGQWVNTLDLGERLYRSGNMETRTPACSGCHSPTGQGNGPAGVPRLGGQHADYIKQQLISFRSGLRDSDGDTRIMRSVAKHMSDAEIDAVSNYVSGLH